MQTELTLTVETSVVERAQAFARSTGSSLPELIKNYLRNISKDESASIELSPEIKRLKGAVRLPDCFDQDKELGESLMKKHSR